MNYSEALAIASQVKDLLAPHCERIEIAGSIRRKCAVCNDIEIVAIPKPYETGLFESGIAAVVNRWEKVKGELEYKGRPGVRACRYTQRKLPQGVLLDLFFATPDNWGYILAIRTGSTRFNQHLINRWKHKGYGGADGYLHCAGTIIPVPEETHLFKLLDIPYCAPEARND